MIKEKDVDDMSYLFLYWENSKKKSGAKPLFLWSDGVDCLY